MVEFQKHMFMFINSDFVIFHCNMCSLLYVFTLKECVASIPVSNEFLGNMGERGA